MDELDSIIRQINEEFGEGTITTANKIPRKNKILGISILVKDL